MNDSPSVMHVQDFHAVPANEVIRAVRSRRDGLTEPEVRQAREDHGANRLPPARRMNPILRFFTHFNNVLIYILLVAGLIKAIYQDWVDFWVIVAVAIVNALIGFVQEGQAEKALAGIRGMLSVHAAVRRDGEWHQVDAEDLVPGDIVRVSPGDKVPADLRLIDAHRLAIDEAALTGESEPSSKQVAPVPAGAGIGDRTNMAYSGTVVTRGTATGIVVATGAGTEIGRIQALVDDVDDLKTPLTEQLDRLGTQFAIGILATAVIMMLAGRVVYQMAPESLLSSVISFAVASVPEGLPALVTITLALGVQQMARHKAITRTMTAVETLGAVTTICSDKTGTLTRNEMTARIALVPGARYVVEGDGYERAGAAEPAGASAPGSLAALSEIVGACNDATLHAHGTSWEIVGEPTEAALAIFARKTGFAATGIERHAVIPFDSAHKDMAVLVSRPHDEAHILVKGAPDKLLTRCASQLSPTGESTPFDPRGWEEAIEGLASQGMRVLAAARKPATSGQKTIARDDIESGLEFVGLVGLVDPPRPEAITAIASCHDAGIRVKMITGDHAETARAISRQLGLADGDEPVVATGTEIEAMSRSQLVEQVADIDVFARTTPEHKIRIVDALQSRREVVAMTGDGVNDAPALTRADVGIAMGIKGTEATKDAADIVLTDDNFATIERAVGEGRRIYNNIQKSVVFLLPTALGQGLIVFASVLLGFEPPLHPTQILWVNLVTAVTLSIALAYEPAEPGIMRHPPRDRDASLLNAWLWVRVTWISLFIGTATIVTYFLMRESAVDEPVARTTAVAVLVIAQIFVLFNSRFLHLSSLHPRALSGNRVVWISAGALFLLQMLFTYVPFMNDWFGSTPLGIGEWAVALAAGALIFLLVEVQKAAQNRRERIRVWR